MSAAGLSRCRTTQSGRPAERFRRGDPKLIALDVLEAMAWDRMGRKVPNGKGHKAKLGSVCVWTEDMERVYVMKRVRRGWLVVTALPQRHTFPKVRDAFLAAQDGRAA